MELKTFELFFNDLLLPEVTFCLSLKKNSDAVLLYLIEITVGIKLSMLGTQHNITKFVT